MKIHKFCSVKIGKDTGNTLRALADGGQSRVSFVTPRFETLWPFSFMLQDKSALAWLVPT
jgi:hypothetical protein